MKCPKCGKPLHHYYSKKIGQWFWAHLYSLDVFLDDKPICDYSETQVYPLNKKKSIMKGVKGNATG